MRVGAATRFTGRYTSDRHAVEHDPATSVTACALADGCTDSHVSWCIASVTSSVAAEKAVAHDVLAAIAAAREENIAHQAGDACMIVARADAQSQDWHLAWVGHVRAYEVKDHVVTQLTTDHAVPASECAPDLLAEKFSADDRPAVRLVPTASLLDHDQPAQMRTTAPRGRLILVTDGVHTALTSQEFTDIVFGADDPQECASLLAQRACDAQGVPDSCTAVVIDPDE